MGHDAGHSKPAQRFAHQFVSFDRNKTVREEKIRVIRVIRGLKKTGMIAARYAGTEWGRMPGIRSLRSASLINSCNSTEIRLLERKKFA